MTSRIGFEDPRLQRMEQATLWLQRMRTADQDDRFVEEWLDWCQRDPLNQQAFDEIAAIWELSAQLPREPVKESAAPRAGISRRALVAAVAGLGVAAATGTWWWNQSRDVVMTAEYSSPIGINSVKKLADGSTLELGGGTRVTVSLDAHERRVELHDGELFVKVHHDKARPFVVVSGWLEAVATGTAFDVLRTDSRTTVTVTEGTVATFHEGRTAAANVALQAGQQLVYSHESHSAAVRQTDPLHAIAWRSGTLYFQGEPMSEVIASLNRYSARGIVTEDARIRELPITGAAHTTAAGIQEWLEGVPALFSFPVVVKQYDDGRWSLASQSVVPD